MLGVFVQMDKDPDHVKMWKAGLKSLDIDSASEPRGSSKAPKSTEERELVEKTGMGWVEQDSDPASGHGYGHCALT